MSEKKMKTKKAHAPRPERTCAQPPTERNQAWKVVALNPTDCLSPAPCPTLSRDQWADSFPNYQCEEGQTSTWTVTTVGWSDIGPFGAGRAHQKPTGHKARQRKLWPARFESYRCWKETTHSKTEEFFWTYLKNNFPLSFIFFLPLLFLLLLP